MLKKPVPPSPLVLTSKKDVKETVTIGGGAYGEVSTVTFIKDIHDHFSYLGSELVLKNPLSGADRADEVKQEIQRETKVLTHLTKQQQKDAKAPPYTTQGEGVILDNQLAIVMKREGVVKSSEQVAQGISLDIINGTVKEFILNISSHLQDQKELDLDVVVALIVNSQYQAIQHLHANGVLHLDAANRNFLMRAPLPGESKAGYLINFASVISDFGKAIVVNTPNELNEQYDIPSKLALKLCNSEMAIHGFASPKSDLYAIRMAMLESFACLDDPNFKGVFAKLKPKDVSDLAAQTKSDNAMLAKAMVEIPKGKFSTSLYDCYSPFILNVSWESMNGHSLDLDQGKYRESDATRLKQSNELFIKRTLIKYMFQDQGQIEKFTRTVAMLLQMPVTPAFEKSDLYKLCQGLNNPKLSTDEKYGCMGSIFNILELQYAHDVANYKNAKKNSNDATLSLNLRLIGDLLKRPESFQENPPPTWMSEMNRILENKNITNRQKWVAICTCVDEYSNENVSQNSAKFFEAMGESPSKCSIKLQELLKSLAVTRQQVMPSNPQALSNEPATTASPYSLSPVSPAPKPQTNDYATSPVIPGVVPLSKTTPTSGYGKSPAQVSTPPPNPNKAGRNVYDKTNLTIFSKPLEKPKQTTSEPKKRFGDMEKPNRKI